MLGLGPAELLILLALVLVIFGGRRLPELARGLGKSITNFKAGLNEGQDDPTAATETTAAREKETTQNGKVG